MTEKDKEIAACELSPHEVKVLAVFAGRDRAGEDEVAAVCGLAPDQVRRALEWLKIKGCLGAEEESKNLVVTLSEGGQYALKRGLTPELELLSRLDRQGGRMPVAAARELEGYPPEGAGKALGNLKKSGAAGIDQGMVESTGRGREQFHQAMELVRRVGVKSEMWEEVTAGERELISHYGKKRGGGSLFHLQEKKRYRYLLTPLGRSVRDYEKERQCCPTNWTRRLTSELLKTGRWQEAQFRPFAIRTDAAPRRLMGRKHPYRLFLDEVKSKLVAMGFVEMSGDLVETEFWNMDALFMPQFHPAREIHDVYQLKEPASAGEVGGLYLNTVAAVHENGGATGSRGWRYSFNREQARRLILRSQGTALSARTLAGRPAVPGKYFAMARCFRPDVVDATHAPDFFQVEGIVVDQEITFRELLGLLKLFALEVARASEMFFAPAYFPFTEPSVEVHMRHPELGWMELGGAGLFRPEVTRPLGVEAPVIAWGLGLDRMAMVALGIEDIRDLFSSDLDFIRATRMPVREE